MTDEASKREIEKCDALLVSAVDIFAEELTELAAQSPDGLTPEAVAELARRVRLDKGWKPRARFLQEINECLRTFEESLWSQARRQYFERYLVRRFVHMFPADSRNPEGKGLASRRLLPGFFIAAEMMMGKPFFEKCQTACKRIVHERQDQAGHPLPWDELEHDPKANRVVDDALVTMARHFADLDARVHWLTDLINGNLAPFEDYAFEGPDYSSWEITETGTRNLLRYLFFPFKGRLAKPEGREKFEARYGPDSLEAMDHLIGILYA